MNGKIVKSICLVPLLVLLVTGSAASGTSTKADYVNYVRKVISGIENPSSNILMWLLPKGTEGGLDVRILNAAVSDQLLARFLQQELVDMPNPRELAKRAGKDGMIIEISSSKNLKFRVPNHRDKLLIANFNSPTEAKFIRSTHGPSFFMDSWH